MKNYTLEDLEKDISGLEKSHQVMEMLIKIIQKNKKKKGASLIEDIALNTKKMLDYQNAIIDKTNIFHQLLDEKLRAKKIQSIKASYSKLNKQNLIDELIKEKLLSEGYKLKIKSQDEQIKFLDTFFTQNQKNRLEINKKKQTNKNKVYKNNNDCLKACFDAFAANLGRSTRGSDYPSYKKFLLKQYPTPPFIPKARLTLEEKKQSKQIQTEDRDLKTRDTWSDATLRAAFKKFSGKNPTSLKK